MAGPLTVSIADLRTALVRALDATEKRLGPEVTLDVDYYWHLPVEEAFNMAGEPSTFTVGQVSDDLEETVQDEHESLPEAAWHDLSHLIGVLRALELAARSRRQLIGMRVLFLGRAMPMRCSLTLQFPAPLFRAPHLRPSTDNR